MESTTFFEDAPIRNRWHRRPQFDSLEPRLELTASAIKATMYPLVYPLGTVGPLPKDAHIGTSAAPATDTPPDIELGGPSWMSIGGGVNVIVDNAPGGMQQCITKVEYEIGGGAIDKSSYKWTPQLSSYQITEGATHEFPVNPQNTSDSFGFFWDQNPEAKSVTIKVTYADGSHFESTCSNLEANAPEGSKFQITVAPDQFGPKPNDPTAWGLYSETTDNGATNAGVHYVAQITLANNLAGTGGFLQLYNGNIVAKGTTPQGTFTQSTIYPQGLMAFDGPDNQQDPILYERYSVTLNTSGATTVGGSQGAPPHVMWNPVDAPGQYLPDPNVGRKTLTKSVSLTQTFKTYLDYQPSGGIHVAIGEIDWSITATATYNGPANPTTAQYQNPANWVLNAPQPAVSDATYTRQLIKWSTSAQDANQNYYTQGP